MKTKLLLLSFLCCLFLYSCEYEPDGSYFKDVNQNVQADTVTINLNYVSDTILVFATDTTSLAYNYSTGKNKVNHIYFIINNTDTIKYTSGQFIYTFDATKYSSQEFVPIRVEVYTSSSTGSMADVLEKEQIESVKNWTIKILQSRDELVGTINTTDENGRLKISWNTFQGTNFKYYLITRENNYGYDTIAIISDQQQTWAYDSLYVGDSCQYNVSVYVNNGRYKNITHVNHALPQLSVTSVGDKSLKFSWPKNNYYNNFGAYRLYYYDKSGIKQEIKSFSSINDTTYVYDKALFGTLAQFALAVIPAKTPDFTDYTTQAETYAGETFTYFPQYTAYSDNYYYYNSGSLVRQNRSNKADQSSISLTAKSTTISAKAKYLLVCNSSKKILLLNGSDLSTATEIASYQISGASEELTVRSISETGIGILNNSGYYFIYDFVNNKLIYTSNCTNTTILIAPDGQYFYMGGALFKINSTSVEQVWNGIITGYTVKSHVFLPNNPSKIALVLQKNTIGAVRIIDRETRVQDVAYDIDMNNYIDMDVNNLQALVVHDNKFKLYDINTGKSLSEIPTYYSENAQEVFKLYNKTIYWKKGYKTTFQY